MKATVLTFFLILSVIVNVCAQKANVTISEPTYVKGRTGTKLILGEKDGKIFVVSQYGNNDKNPTLHVETYDAKSLKQSASNKVELSNTESTKSDLEAITLEDQLYIWYSQRYRSKESKNLVNQAVLTPVGDGMPKGQKELDYFPIYSSRDLNSYVSYRLSQDRTKLIIYNVKDSKDVAKENKDKTVLDVIIYDNALKQILKKEIIIDIEPDMFGNINDIECNNNYDITFICNVRNYKSKFSQLRNLNTQYSIHGLYSVKKSEKTVKEVLIFKKDRDITNIRMVIDREENIILIGLYDGYINPSQNQATTEYGTFFTKLNGKDLSVLEEKTEKFSAKILKEVVGSDKKINFRQLGSIDVKIIDGFYYFLAKTIRIETEHNDGVTKSYSYDQDILLYQFAPTGEILWDAIIPRRVGNTGLMSGFYEYYAEHSTIKLNYIFVNSLPVLFYYDAPANLSKTSSTGLVNVPLKLDQAMLVMVTVDETGKWKKQNLTPALKGVKPLNIRDARRTSDGSLIFISGEKDQEKLVKISVTN